MTPPETARHQARPPKLFKSRKELIMLSLASVVFVIVIYKTYLSKGSSPAETAEINPAVLDASGTADRPAPSVHEALARLNTDDTPAPEQPQPLPLSRDPFSMSPVLRDGIYRVNPAQDQTSSEPVVITA